jgi:hypothetical protein
MKPAILLSVVLAQMIVAPAMANDARSLASLSKLDPYTRLEQICDLYAMNRIDRDSNPFHPDRAKADVISHPRHVKNTIIGTGGAFRSGGKWYQFSFECKGSPDAMSVVSFTYKIGNVIPEAKWASYGLWR